MVMTTEEKKEALRKHIEFLNKQLEKAEKGEEFLVRQTNRTLKLKYSPEHKAAIIKILQTKGKGAALVIGFLDKEFFTKEFDQEIEKELIEAGVKILDENKPNKRKEKIAPVAPEKLIPEKHK
jgi:membrane carboxypeptidase/penicillin-binding protein